MRRVQTNPPWSGLLPLTVEEEDQEWDLELWRVISVGSPIKIYLKGQVIDINGELEKLVSETKSRWAAAGFSPRLVEIATERATAWSASMSEMASPDIATAIAVFKHLLPLALQHSETWMRRMIEGLSL